MIAPRLLVAAMMAGVFALPAVTVAAVAAPARPAAAAPARAATTTRAATPAAAHGSDLRLVPAPRSLTPGAGTFALRGELKLATSGDREDQFAAGLLKEEIEGASAAKVRLVEGGDGDIVLARDAGLADA